MCSDSQVKRAQARNNVLQTGVENQVAPPAAWKLKQPCKIAKPSKTYPSTYVNLNVTSVNGYGDLVNVEDPKPKNHRGRKNDLNDCCFELFGGQPFSTCNSQGIGTNAFSEFSIAL